MAASNMRNTQQQQSADGAPCRDCAIEKILSEGMCKKEFLAFDSCYDAAQARGQKEEPCLPLFEQFRACMKNRATVDQVVKEAMG